MIASLSGILRAKDERSCIVEVGGVGFKVAISTMTAAALPHLGEAISLATALYLRERDGSIELFGFLRRNEQAMFELLLQVPGVGPKGALAILSGATVDELERAIASGEEKLLMRVSGIGRKKAQKILIELKERYESLSFAEGENAEDTIAVLDALRGFGYSEREAREALRQIPKEVTTAEERMRAALRILGKKV